MLFAQSSSSLYRKILIIVSVLRKFGYKLDSGNGGNAVFAEGITKPVSGFVELSPSVSIGGALGA